MSLRQAAEEVIQGRQARKEMKYISSNAKIAKKCEVGRSVVERVLLGLPTRLATDEDRGRILALKAEHHRLLTIQRYNALPISAYRHGFTPSQIRAELQRMGVEL
jgi:hypothetical protein